MFNLFICIYICILLLLLQYHTMAIMPMKTVSVFRNDEIIYHKYAAALAATEPFRIQLTQEIKESMNPLSFLIHHVKGTFKTGMMDLRLENVDIDAACYRYERRVDEIVKSYGLSTESFNKLSEFVGQDSHLKKRILLQAYYYRIAADLEANTKERLPILPSMSSSDNVMKFSHNERDILLSDSFTTSNRIRSEPQITRFCKCLRAIEFERIKQREHLQKSLGIHELPERMCDDDICPAMSKEIQHACHEFRSHATSVLKKHGLEINDFNKLQKKIETNIFFRNKVQGVLKSLETNKSLAE